MWHEKLAHPLLYYLVHVARPHHILDGRCGQLCHSAALLDIKQDDLKDGVRHSSAVSYAKLMPCGLQQVRSRKLHSCAHLVLAAAEQKACASIEEGVCGAVRCRTLLGDLVAQVLNLDRGIALVQHSKAIAGNEHSRGANATLGLLQVAGKYRRQSPDNYKKLC